MEIKCSNIDELPLIAKNIIENCQGKKFVFIGELGAGKTTLIKELCKHLGVQEVVNSPTFTILNEYESPNETIFHFDFYRLNKPEEIFELGYEEYFYSDNYVFVEWPEKIGDFIPDDFSVIRIKVTSPTDRIFSCDI